MKLIKIINSRAAVGRLTQKRINSFAVARKLAALRKRVDEETEFFNAEQSKTLKEHAEFENGRPVTEGGGIKMKSTADLTEYESEMQRLFDTEIEGIEPVAISEADFRGPEDYPTPEDMLALDGLVDFVEATE